MGRVGLKSELSIFFCALARREGLAEDKDSPEEENGPLVAMITIAGTRATASPSWTVSYERVTVGIADQVSGDLI